MSQETKIKSETTEEFKIQFAFRTIEILNFNVSFPNIPDFNPEAFTFTLKVEHKVKEVEKLIFVLISVQIKNEDQSIQLFDATICSIFYLENFEEVVSKNKEDMAVIDLKTSEILNSISISTTRGVLFALLKGTPLHNALLPIIDPKKFEIQQIV